MGGDPTAEHLDELRPGRFEPSSREINQSLGIRFASHERLEYRAAAGPEDVAPTELYVVAA